jgi:hypothetical protein
VDVSLLLLLLLLLQSAMLAQRIGSIATNLSNGYGLRRREGDPLLNILLMPSPSPS